MTLLDEYVVQDSPTATPFDAKGTLAEGGQYEWKMTNTFGYNFGGGKANVGPAVALPAGDQGRDGGAQPRDDRVPGRLVPVVNLFAGYEVNDRMDLRMGIDNLLDEEPLIVGARPPMATPRSLVPTTSTSSDVVRTSA